MVRPLRAAFVGLGGVVQTVHLAAVRSVEGLELSACVDVKEDLVKLFTERLGCGRGYTDYREMLEREKPDVVLIATPHRFHAEMAVEVLRSGAHVYLEKPVATNFEDALRVVEQSRRVGRILVVGHHMRVYSSLTVARKLVSSGRLGRLYYGRSIYVRRRGIPNTPGFVKKSLAEGGALLDIGSHALDSILFISGHRVPERVLGVVERAFSKRPEMLGSYPLPRPPKDLGEVEVEDFGAGFVKLSGGLAILVEAGWASYSRDELFEITLLGDHGGVSTSGKGERLSYMTSVEGELIASEVLIERPREPPYNTVWRLFAEAIRKGMDRPPYPLCTPEQAALYMAAIDAIYKSSILEREVEISIPKTVADNLGWGDQGS